MRLAAVLFLAPALAAYAGEREGFEKRIHHGIRYRLFIPDGYDPGKKYPLVLWLHGIESVGSDNQKQISGFNYSGSHVWTKYPCFILAPQCPQGAVWANPITRRPSGALSRVVEILELLGTEFSVDDHRIYAVGQSMGGFGVWALVAQYPDLFAAAIPVCGGGDPQAASAMAGIPIWAFHGARDPIVWVHESRRMIAAIRKAGGNPKYTEYPNGLHIIWDRVFSDPEMTRWLFEQSRREKGAGNARPRREVSA